MTSETMPNLYLVRHAESLQNVNQNLDRDSSLTKIGHRQAVEAGITLRSIFNNRQPGAIIHTGLTRTIDTAQAIKTAGEFDTPLVEIPEFREREMGIYDHMEFSELVQRNPYMESLYQQYGGSCVWFFDGSPGEGVEPLTKMKSRIIKGLRTICNSYVNQLVVVVAHAGSVKIIKMLYEMPSGINLPEYLSSYVPKNGEIYKMRINR